MKLTIILIITMLCVTSMAYSQNTSTLSVKRYVKVPAGYLMVLHQGDNVFAALEDFAVQENIPSATFTGMGFVDITFGFFNSKTRQYTPKDFKGVELASMQGTIAWKDGKLSIHSHAVAGDKSFQAFAGHVLGATVSTGSLEIMLTIHDKRFQRKKDEALGADVLQLE